MALLVPDAGEVSLWEDALKTTTDDGQILEEIKCLSVRDGEC